MPLQNRVTPFGDIIATAERGLLTGNRGIIHDPATGTLLTKRWAGVVEGHSHLRTLGWARGWLVWLGVVWRLASRHSQFWAKLGMSAGGSATWRRPAAAGCERKTPREIELLTDAECEPPGRHARHDATGSAWAWSKARFLISK